MVGKVRVLILILIVLIVVSLSLANRLFYLLQKEQAKNSALQTELESTKKQQQIIETKLEESKKMVSTLELKLRESEGRIDTLTRDLEQEKTAKQEALTQVEQLGADLEKKDELSSALENKLTQVREDTKKKEAQLKELEARKSELETKLNELEAKSKSAVELGTIVVGSEAGSPGEKPSESTGKQRKKTTVTSSLEGKVLVVNKDYNFVVINLGTKDGLDIGDIFSVQHNNKYIGDVKVEKVHDSMSAAGFASMEMKDKVNEGDKVLLKTK